MDNILKMADVCERLQCSKFTIYTLINTGKLVAFKLGHEWRFKESELNKYIEKQTYTAPQAVKLHGIYSKPSKAKAQQSSPQRLTMDMIGGD